MGAASPASGGPLAGLVVADLSTTLAGVYATQFLSDCGADVIMVESPDGSPIRQLPGWPGLLRGKRSVALDVHDDADASRFWQLLHSVDVLVTTMRPSTAERFGLTPEQVAERCPRLVVASITGWGSVGPWRNYKGWEALVMAKIGIMHEKRAMTPRPGPAYISVPYASWGAAHAAVQGILAAVIERESSGRGQIVESNLVTGVGSMDPWNWFQEMVLDRYPGAFEPMEGPYDEQGRPQAHLVYPLLAAPTKDGRWLQFAQVSPRLMQAWLTELDLMGELTASKWQGFPMLPTPELRMEFWDMMLERVAARTLDEWQQAFAENHDLSGELFRSPEESLDHPQTVHEGRSDTVTDPDLGPVRQPSTLIHADGKPLTVLRPAPRIGEHTSPTAWEAQTLPRVAADDASPTALPLAGVTILEFGSMYAGPYGATLLTDLGARVIKIEPVDGDNIRTMLAYPEAAGAKVLQGKESCAIDITQAEGLELAYELVKRCDLVLQCFRGKAAERAKIDEATLKALNPDVVVLSTSGYGIDGPFAHRAAYAPTIAAASGLSVVDSGVAGHPPTSVEDVRRTAPILFAGGSASAVQADGIAALGVASALLVGLYAKRRGVELHNMTTTMLATTQQALITHNVSYPGRPALETADEDFHGINALYRMYRAADGWVFLAAPLPREWPALAKAMSPYVNLHTDERFASAASRAQHDDALVTALEPVFAIKTKLEWERELCSQDVGCVEVTERSSGIALQSDDCFEAGYSVESDSPIFDVHRRLAPVCKFSRSQTKADAGCTVGQHTELVLREIGIADEWITDLHKRGIVSCG
ncbi:CoA-transferase [Mycobacterium colombiense]|uniref:CaiB/BaiF CoA-transferase family protein n=1 Tax=Mycobacterium colombiense TaxID=339268 RepID=UPI0007EFF3B9|nr:CoA transferase [Mycobacterium colombiense]OBK63277.1 CoA-transferase [Mycobacterium colombiense]